MLLLMSPRGCLGLRCFVESVHHAKCQHQLTFFFFFFSCSIVEVTRTNATAVQPDKTDDLKKSQRIPD
jgi:hypothetical protein